MSYDEPVLLFPGQGAYVKGLLLRIRDQMPGAEDVLDAAARTAHEEFGLDLDALARDPDRDLPDLLDNAPALLQAAIYTAAVASSRALQKSGISPVAHLGHSAGEIAALAAADACSIEDGLRVVLRRSQILAEAGLPPACMVAAPLTLEQAKALLAVLEEPHLEVAGRNEERQTVLSGPEVGVERAEQMLRAAGLQATRLAASYPFHNSLLRPAARLLNEALADIRFQAPAVPVYSPIAERFYGPDDDLAGALAEHLVRPFDFLEAVHAIHKRTRPTMFVECGGRSMLTGIVSRVLGDDSSYAAVATDTGAARGAHLGHIVALANPGLSPQLEPLRQLLEPAPAPEDFTLFWAAEGPGILRTINRAYTAFRGTEPAGHADEPAAAQDQPPQPAAPPAAAITTLPERPQLFREIVALYSDMLEYPEDVFEEQTHLEADLGIDSVKQTELLARITEKYDLPPGPEGFRVADYPTLGAILDLLLGARAPDAG